MQLQTVQKTLWESTSSWYLLCHFHHHAKLCRCSSLQSPHWIFCVLTNQWLLLPLHTAGWWWRSWIVSPCHPNSLMRWGKDWHYRQILKLMAHCALETSFWQISGNKCKVVSEQEFVSHSFFSLKTWIFDICWLQLMILPVLNTTLSQCSVLARMPKISGSEKNDWWKCMIQELNWIEGGNRSFNLKTWFKLNREKRERVNWKFPIIYWCEHWLPWFLGSFGIFGDDNWNQLIIDHHSKFIV